ncbi:MAG: hypothetical protein Phog2KO_48590 [Phototrophicaceae bacterium]
MPYIFRKIRQSRWLERDFLWLEHNEIPSDPLADFTTKQGALSIYVLTNSETETITRVAAAIASTSSSLSNLDYVVIEVEELDQFDFMIESKPATTPDDDVNNMHYDIINLSAQKLVSLTKLFWNNFSQENFGRIPEQIILEQIIFGISQGYMNKQKIKIKSRKLLDHI